MTKKRRRIFFFRQFLFFFPFHFHIFPLAHFPSSENLRPEEINFRVPLPSCRVFSERESRLIPPTKSWMKAEKLLPMRANSRSSLSTRRRPFPSSIIDFAWTFRLLAGATTSPLSAVKWSNSRKLTVWWSQLGAQHYRDKGKKIWRIPRALSCGGDEWKLVSKDLSVFDDFRPLSLSCCSRLTNFSVKSELSLLLDPLSPPRFLFLMQ